MKSFANIPNWHRIVYILIGLGGALVAILTAIELSPDIVPGDLKHFLPYIPLALVVLSAFLPRVQTATGPGAAPLISPPAPSSRLDVIPPPLVDGHDIQRG